MTGRKEKRWSKGEREEREKGLDGTNGQSRKRNGAGMREENRRYVQKQT